MIGDVLKAPDRPAVRVIGVDETSGGPRWVVVPAAEHAAPFVLTDDLAAAYGVDHPSFASEAEVVQMRLNAATAAHAGAFNLADKEQPRRSAQHPGGFSPEEAFEAAQAQHVPAAREVAEAIIADPEKLRAITEGHVGIHRSVQIELEKIADELAE